VYTRCGNRAGLNVSDVTLIVCCVLYFIFVHFPAEGNQGHRAEWDDGAVATELGL
jgi:hypothetical protein